MPIILNGQTLKAYKGDSTPINIYQGESKLSGWIEEEKSGESVEFSTSYNDTADVVVTGNTVQSSDWYAKDGLSSQVQTVQGKNLFDKSKAITDYYWSSTNTLNPYSNSFYSPVYIKVNVGENYIMNCKSGSSVQYMEYDSNKTFIQRLNKSINEYYTVPSGVSYIRVSWYNQSTTVDTAQLELGTTTTSYAPFVPNSPSPEYPSPVTSNLPSGSYKYTSTDGIYEFTLSDDLRGIGSTVDKIVFDRISHKAYLEKRCGKYIIPTNTVWNDYSSGGSIRCILYTDNRKYGYNSLGYFSHGGVLNTSLGSNNSGVVSAYYGNSATYFYPVYTSMGLNGTEDITTANAKLQSWIISNSPYFTFILATSTRTPITFTKVSSSTKTEVPMTFLTSTPSLDYPASVWDVSGNVRSRGKNVVNYLDMKNTPNLTSSVQVTTKDGFNCYRLANGAWGSYMYQFLDVYVNPRIIQGNQYVISFDVCEDTNMSNRAHPQFGFKYTDGSYSTTPITDSGTFTRVSLVSNPSKTIKSIWFTWSTQVNSAWYLKDFQIEVGSEMTSYEPFIETLSTLPTLRKIGSVSDEYNPKTGVLTKRISDWVTLDGSKLWSLNNGTRSGFKEFAIYSLLNTISESSGIMFKNDSTVFPYGVISETFRLGSNKHLVMNIANTTSGFGDMILPTSDEIKAYFYGWKMCNADGTSPYYKSEVPYTPSTWAEWIVVGGTIAKDSTGMKFTCTINTNSISYMSNLNMNPSTKYGILYNVVESTLNGNLLIGWTDEVFNDVTTIPKSVGNQKSVLTSKSSIINNRVHLATSSANATDTYIKIKDFRIFELPTGSQIESDFNTLTADQLCAKYTFNGLCVKNWKKITDGTGQTTTLPTASYDGYTPYKMLYQLATPVESQLTPSPIPTYYPTTVIETDCVNAIPTITATAKIEE